MIETDEIMYFTLDFSKCKTLGEIYAVIKTGLELPDWVGENLAAFWDSLTGIMYTPAEITVKQNFSDPQLHDYIEKLIGIMYRAKEKYGEITVKVEMD
ncbi:MAG: barstar family protein [Clostridia bacterium]|nr:barstar family protein [Clostridia bacterium]